ncbi:uncharacterized protein PFL1_04343 [Pseudozyma flocculosa PF-1]|uniref:Chromo domain-containing protein n=2 Tax=Pseudozyma flocculosa TaxID=84751 RepID=A0A5C3FDP7_9BASI|nr:uncharacterized protein PFL1_04343 [Pseudozyma flocculosa PF-1]EPQ28016.1 hypothetical protein PFL1_04343 [Pseudozyma flocculosa PF-1]SPO41591.1 uncharacterized protein PSFLO_07073 [Pseudozyma flocculosa]
MHEDQLGSVGSSSNRYDPMSAAPAAAPSSDAATAIDVDADGDDYAAANSQLPDADEGAADAAGPIADGGEGAAEGEEEEEEYEIESILSHEVGRFVEGEMAYLVSWKDYGEEHNSWVREADAEGAQDMINEYWAKTPRKEIKKAGPTPKSRKKGGKTQKTQSSLLASNAVSSPSAATSKKRARESVVGTLTRTRGSQGMPAPPAPSTSIHRPAVRGAEELPSRSPSPYEADEMIDAVLEEIANDDSLTPADKVKLKREHMRQVKLEYMKRKYGRIGDWEPIVRHITGIENIGGKLWAYMDFISGDQLGFPVQVVEERCPRVLCRFLLSHVRFKTTDGIVEYLAPTPEPSSAAPAAASAAPSSSVGDGVNGESAARGGKSPSAEREPKPVAEGESEAAAAAAAKATDGAPTGDGNAAPETAPVNGTGGEAAAAVPPEAAATTATATSAPEGLGAPDGAPDDVEMYDGDASIVAEPPASAIFATAPASEPATSAIPSSSMTLAGPESAQTAAAAVVAAETAEVAAEVAEDAAEMANGASLAASAFAPAAFGESSSSSDTIQS